MSEKTQRAYCVVVEHDEGLAWLRTVAYSMKSAANIVIRSENCPRRAIKRIIEIKESFVCLDYIDRFRFWTIHDEHPVRLTVERDKDLETYYCSNHCEGWSSEYTRFWIEDNFLWCEVTSDGRDCDGRLTQTYVYRSHLCELETQEPFLDFQSQFKLPRWENVDSSKYDEYAQAAGY